ncbi:MAG: exopolysaccharide biosynthesis protein, partial [Verrucomicrobiaceae bacterium]
MDIGWIRSSFTLLFKARGERRMSDEIPVVKPRKLSEDIDSLLLLAADRPLRLQEVISVIQGRAYTLLLILLSLPFCLPVPVPGLSTAFGAVIALIGFRLSLRLEPWLPERILNAEMSSANVTRLLSASKRVARVLEKLMKPRWSFLVDWRVMNHIYGGMICICGLLLLLPLPIPFSNLL